MMITIKKLTPTVTFTATPDLIPPGGSSTLAWTTTDADTVTINQGVGSVDLNGSQSISPATKTVYTITAVGTGGTAKASVTVRMLATHLNSVWNGMKTAMQNGDVTLATEYFSDQTRDQYSQIFSAIADQLPQIALGMRDIEPVYFGARGDAH
jgi:hypothetical protein